MADQVSFKTRVKETAISIAPDYYSYYVRRDYLLISDAFKNSPYYIVRAKKDNNLHLVGVSPKLSATAFFDKCLNGTLDESDFEIATHGQDEMQSKGSIRRKSSLFRLLPVFSLIQVLQKRISRKIPFCAHLHPLTVLVH